MEKQNKYGLRVVSTEVFAHVFSQIPEGRITCISHLLGFFANHYGEMVYLDFPAYMEDPRGAGLAWWRIVSEEGVVLNGLEGIMEEQTKFLDAYMSEQSETALS